MDAVGIALFDWIDPIFTFETIFRSPSKDERLAGSTSFDVFCRLFLPAFLSKEFPWLFDSVRSNYTLLITCGLIVFEIFVLSNWFDDFDPWSIYPKLRVVFKDDF